MENLEQEVYLTSRSHCRVGKITAKKNVEDNKLIQEGDSQK